MNLTPRFTRYTREEIGGRSSARRGDVTAMRLHSIARAEKRPLRFDDDVKFLRTWIEKPLATGKSSVNCSLNSNGFHLRKRSRNPKDSSVKSKTLSME